MKYILLLVPCIACAILLQAQVVVSGKITNSRNEPVSAASISVKASGKTVISDSIGQYSIELPLGKQVLLVSSVGYTSKEIAITVADQPLQVNIVLRVQVKQLGEVFVSAGTFEASDKAKGASLSPMDAVTVAGSGADLANALRALPGAQQVGEKEGLFVRGGTSDEAKQFVDGTLLKNPNFAAVPGIIQPARLNPFLFKGILFNTGAYSALYGDALSSALILETVDLPEKSEAGLHFFPSSLGGGIQRLSKDRKSSFGITSSYGNPAPYNRVVKQNVDFLHAPEYFNTDINFRVKTSKTGILKFYGNYGYNHTALRQQDVDSLPLFSGFENEGINLYGNLSYRESLNPNWRIDAALAYNFSRQNIAIQLQDSNKNTVAIPDFLFRKKNIDSRLRSNFAQARLVLTRKFNQRQALRFGLEHFYNDDDIRSNDSLFQVKDQLIAGFVEADVQVVSNLAVKLGWRAEYSSHLDALNLAPRVSIGYRLPDGSQFNLGYGIFYQKPALDLMMRAHSMEFNRATHYIVNYIRKANNRLIRLEAYYKKYQNLQTSWPEIGNNGAGYARGIELFFRDKKTIKDLDYWISYTYLDTKRQYNQYPMALQPEYATPHTAAIAVKRFFPEIKFSANLSYAIASGRPYYDIREDGPSGAKLFASGKTNMYSQMNLSFAYLFVLFKKWKHADFSGIGFGMNNVFGTRQIFGYRYSQNGVNRLPITQPATRSFYIGLFMSFGVDRRDDFIDQNL